MSRIFKFRAWDKKEKVMCPVSVTNWEKGCFLVGNSPTPDKIEGNFIIGGVEEGHFVNFEDLVLMQFTGMLDKNLSDIYEGDILSRRVNEVAGDFASPLVHKRDYYRIVFFQDGAFVDKYTGRLILHLYDHEIIGNIYENPELLEQ
jgi:uncharacterized phage protein (TIGR01671 family)